MTDDDARATTRAEILAAFDVTEADIAAIDNGYTEARRQADAQRQAFIDIHLTPRPCARCGSTVPIWYGPADGQHVGIVDSPMEFAILSADSDDPIRFVVTQDVRLAHCEDLAPTAS